MLGSKVLTNYRNLGNTSEVDHAAHGLTDRIYYPELDALRFFAFFLVFLHHVAPHFPRDYAEHFPAAIADVFASAANMFGLGLPLFFFLSAFLITDLLAREKLKTGTIRSGYFYTRRILRIWPLYFLGIVIGVTAAAVAKFCGLEGNYGDWRMLFMFLTFNGNWYFATEDAWPPNPMSPLWSISVEEQFYLLWPAVFRLASLRELYDVCAIMAAAAIGTEMFLGCTHAHTVLTVWTNSFVQFEMFAAGAALAFFLNGNTPRIDKRSRLALAILSLFMWFVSIYRFQAKYEGPALSGTSIVIGYLLVTSGCAAIVISTLGAKCHIPAFLIYLGRISFGLYVFHLLAIDIVNWIELSIVGVSGWYSACHLLSLMASFMLTIFMAALSYRFLEAPFLRLKERFTIVASRPV